MVMMIMMMNKHSIKHLIPLECEGGYSVMFFPCVFSMFMDSNLS